MRGNFTRFLVGMIIFGAFFVLLPDISYAQFQIVPKPSGFESCLNEGVCTDPGACHCQEGICKAGGALQTEDPELRRQQEEFVARLRGNLQDTARLPVGSAERRAVEERLRQAEAGLGVTDRARPAGAGDVECTYTFCDLVRIFTNIARIIFGTAGGLALLYFLWGTVSLITSGGSAEKVAAGKKSIFAAIWGLFIVLISYQLVGVLLVTAADISGTKGGTAGGIQVEKSGRITIFTRPWSELQRCAPSLIQTTRPSAAPAPGAAPATGVAPAPGAAPTGGTAAPGAPSAPVSAPSAPAGAGTTPQIPPRQENVCCQTTFTRSTGAVVPFACSMVVPSVCISALSGTPMPGTTCVQPRCQ